MISKKIVFFVLFSCLLRLSFSQENAIANAINQQNMIIESTKDPSSRDAKKAIPFSKGWSLGFGFGATQFDGDIRQYDHYPAYQEIGNFYELKSAFSLLINKQVNSFYSLSAEFVKGQFSGLRRPNEYLGYTVYDAYDNGNGGFYEGNGDKFVASFYEADALVNINLTNIMSYFFRTKIAKNLFFEGKIGMGYNIYNSIRRNLFSDTYLYSFGYADEGTGDIKKSLLTSPSETVYIYGVKANYKLNSKINIFSDYTIRNGRTDKWDASLMNTQNGSDMFAFLSLGMSYKIGNHDFKSEWESPIEGLKTDVEELFVQIDGFTDDSDNDGVSDAFDKKPNTPLGVAVDGAGIALDVDMDNVPDYRDADPFSYRGAIVDENGVELDDDKDGVPNSKDLETNTRVGVMVNQFGISVNNNTYTGSGGMIYFPSVFFNSGSAVVVTSNKNRLATIAIVLKSNPDVKMKVIGHTDIVGDADFNKKLGLKRANAVINYLNVHYNIDSKRLIPETKGEEDPLSKQTQINNGIEDGSSIDSFLLEINRRVDFDIID